MRRRLEPLAHVALLLAALLACKSGSKGGGASGGPAPTVAEEQPSAVVTASDLLAEYKGNEVRGDLKYKGKLVAIAGIVGDIKKDFTDSAYITLGRGAELELETVHCELKSGQEGIAAGLSKGQKAVFKGRVAGYVMLSVSVKDCEYWAEASKPAPAAPAKVPSPAPRPAPPPPRKR